MEMVFVYRLLLAVVLGGLIGIEREQAHKSAGLRTHILVALGSTLITFIAVYGFENLGGNSPEVASRIIANIIIGIGFVGGGAILRHGDQTVGLTTASTLWLTSAIGIAIGMGFVFAALITTLIGYATLTILLGVEQQVLKRKNQQSVKE
jgi:putative Mg2+ transporter-C (MgtC) family protein